jgi:hypothetical protein
MCDYGNHCVDVTVELLFFAVPFAKARAKSSEKFQTPNLECRELQSRAVRARLRPCRVAFFATRRLRSSCSLGQVSSGGSR